MAVAVRPRKQCTPACSRSTYVGGSGEYTLPPPLPAQLHPEQGSPCRCGGSKAGSCETTERGSGPHRCRRRRLGAAETGRRRPQPQAAPRGPASAPAPGPPKPEEGRVRGTTQGPACHPSPARRPAPSPFSGQSLAAVWPCLSGCRPPSGMGAGQTPAGEGAQRAAGDAALVLPQMLLRVAQTTSYHCFHPKPSREKNTQILGSTAKD